MHFFKGGAIHACNKPSVTKWEAPSPYILNVHKTSRVPKHYITQHDSVHAGPL